MPNFIIHPGAPKTATTFLQNEVFDKHPEILNIGRPNHGSQEHAAMFRALIHQEDAEQARSLARQFYDAEIAKSGNRDVKTIVYSNESLSDASLNSTIAKRLHSAFPDAHILLTVRSQLALVPSMFTGDRAILKNVPAPYAGKPVRFEDWFDHAFASADTPDAKCMNFHRTYRAYADQFGAGQVRVMLFERFVRERAGFLEDLGEFLGVEGMLETGAGSAPKANPSPSARLTAYQSLRSWVLPGRSITGLLPGAAAIRAAFDRFLKSGQSLQVELNAAQRDRIAQLYGEGNRRLAENCKLDLKAEGYPV